MFRLTVRTWCILYGLAAQHACTRQLSTRYQVLFLARETEGWQSSALDCSAAGGGRFRVSKDLSLVFLQNELQLGTKTAAASACTQSHNLQTLTANSY